MQGKTGRAFSVSGGDSIVLMCKMYILFCSYTVSVKPATKNTYSKRNRTDKGNSYLMLKLTFLSIDLHSVPVRTIKKEKIKKQL